jgi:methionine-S-sulfoxide reductase
MKTIYLAGGCFWGCEKFFEQFDGVVNTLVGYANGNTENPSYEDVKHRGTGHAETVRIDFDEARISTEELLDSYFLVIDPLSVNRQGEDEGIQYRTGVYYTSDDQLPALRAAFEREAAKVGAPLKVELLPLQNFFPAEEYHQKYLEKNPGGYCHIPQRMFSLRKD